MADLPTLPAGHEGPHRMWDAIGENIGSNKGNRATTLLKRAGLIHYDRAARVWRQGKAP